ncbi:MAG: hypothetical protein ACLPKB_27350 [Xanthobacteraceae bacterium]
MGRTTQAETAANAAENSKAHRNTATVRPSEAQRRYLERGLTQPGGKLPLFDTDGREIPRKTIESCLAHGWATPWFDNPLKADWLVCKLTPDGYLALGQAPGDSLPDSLPD